MKKILLPAIGILLASCGSETARRAAPVEKAAGPVATVTVSEAEWPANYEATGTVRARTTATLSSKATGYVEQVSAQVGQHVTQGQLLIALDTKDLDVSLHHAEAARAVVESAIPELENATAAAKASLDLAQTTFNRVRELDSKSSVSKQEMDEASARLKEASANYEMTRSRHGQVNAQMAQADQAVRAASVMRDHARISAPFSGVVTVRSVEPGNLAAPGVPLLTIEQDGLFRLETSVDESRLAAARVGQTVPVQVEGIGDLNGRVSEIVPSVDPVSRSYVVKLDLPSNAALRTGMFGRAIFSAGTRKVIAIPVTAATEQGQLWSVSVVEGGATHSRLVTTGQRNGDAVEVLSGLNAGEQIAMPKARQ